MAGAISPPLVPSPPKRTTSRPDHTARPAITGSLPRPQVGGEFIKAKRHDGMSARFSGHACWDLPPALPHLGRESTVPGGSFPISGPP